MSRDSLKLKIVEVFQKLQSNQITDNEAMKEIALILPKYLEEVQLSLERTTARLDAVEEKAEMLQNIGIAGMLALDFIRIKDMELEFDAFMAGELSRRIDEVHQDKPLLN